MKWKVQWFKVRSKNRLRAGLVKLFKLFFLLYYFHICHVLVNKDEDDYTNFTIGEKFLSELCETYS